MTLISLALFLALALVATSVLSLAQRLRAISARRAAAFEYFAEARGLQPFRAEN